MTHRSDRLEPPARLQESHDLADFDCGVPALDQWLRRRALQNEASGASRTYVVCSGARVVGYYTLAVGAVSHEEAPGRIRRNMPDPVPVMVLGRLAVDRSFQGRNIGAGLLRDAVLRSIQAAGIAGIRAILVHAVSESAKRFYLKFGFSPTPIDPLTVMITISDAKKALTG